MQDALGFTCNRVYRWRLLLEEYNPEIVYIKGEDNTVADAISRLKYDPTKNVKDSSNCVAIFYCLSMYLMFLAVIKGKWFDPNTRSFGMELVGHG